MLVAGDGDDFSLAEAALLIAQEEHPALAVEHYLNRLHEFANILQPRLATDATLIRRVHVMNEFLFEEQGFKGNVEEYYDPRNSYLDEVLERRLGIPITLSIIYIDIGRRLGLPLQGISFPGRFLVKLVVPGADIVLDPYSGGTSLNATDLENLLRKSYGPEATMPPLARLLVAADKREILVRLLRNLKTIYLHNDQLDKALVTLDIMLLIMPKLAHELRDRAKLFERLECFRAALADYQNYLLLTHNPVNDAEVHKRIAALKQRIALLH